MGNKLRRLKRKLSMEPKLIIRLPTGELSEINSFMEKLKSGNEVVMSDNISILIKNKDGYWHEVCN